MGKDCNFFLQLKLKGIHWREFTSHNLKLNSYQS